MKKKKGILGKIIIGIVAIAVIGSVVGEKDSSGNKEVVSPTTDNIKIEQTVTNEPEQPAKEQPSSGIRKELKEFLDSYEAFMDEYCEFMQSYNSSDLTMMTKYMQILSKYSDFAEKAQAWEGKDLSDAELLYYTESLNRVSQKLLKVGLSMK